jgi:hypothetical protein
MGNIDIELLNEAELLEQAEEVRSVFASYYEECEKRGIEIEGYPV